MREEVKDYLKKVISKNKILEPICEIGSFRVKGQEKFADLRGLFPGKKYIGCDMRVGLGVDRQENVHYLTFPDNSIGTILMLDTLEHVANVYKAMDEVFRVLKPGGLVVISSVMNYPIHDYPFDYWRFTPEAFDLLLEKFEIHKVETDSQKDFPVGVYGFGIKGNNVEKNKYNFNVNLRNNNSVLTKIVHIIGKNKDVLEFGCSSGYLGRALLKKGCRITGIDINLSALNRARRYYEKVISGDIETLDFSKKLGNKRFDFLIFADVLEHLKNPKEALLKAHKYLRKDGLLIVSVPNIAHASVRLELLTGDFEYEKLGILDETHLKYFTKKSILRLLDESGYFIKNIDCTSMGLSKETIEKFFSSAGLKSDKLALNIFNQPESLAYQYLISASLIKPPGYSMRGVLSWPIKAINDTEVLFRKIENDARREINDIYSSRGWKFISFFHRIRKGIPILKDV